METENLSSRGITLVKSHRTITQIELDLRIPTTYLHLYIDPNKLKNSDIENFLKKDNSVKNHRTMTEFELDHYNPMMYPYIKFVLNVCNRCSDNELKLKLSYLF
jgi:hypothetical protein